jgi:Flp pilus assembly protein TadG
MLLAVAIVLPLLMILSAFVVDLGVMWLGRTQAQTAADAAALAGATARRYDEPVSAGPIAEHSVQTAVGANLIFDQPGRAVADYSAGACPSFSPVANGPCVKVEVYRDGTHGSTPLPTYFAALWGQGSQGTRAMAVAQVVSASGTPCLRPFIIPDYFADTNGDGIPNPGEYTAPGYTEADIGSTVTLAAGDPALAISPGNYYLADLSATGGGTAEFIDAVQNCRSTKQVGDPVILFYGRRPMAVVEGINYLIDLDPDAYVDAEGAVRSGCVPRCGSESPRVVAAAALDPVAFELGRSRGQAEWPIANIIPLFIEDVVETGTAAGRVTARIVRSGGVLGSTGAPIGARFLSQIALIQ